jgi:CHAT domain-containing protein/tetratricopeptide (TPR) repeat protein
MRRRSVATLALLLAAVLAAAWVVRGRDDRARVASATTSATPTDSATAPTLARGESLYWGGNYTEARRLWRHMLARTRPGTDSLLVARLLTWIGLASYRLSEYPEARAVGDSALALKRRIGAPPLEVFRSLNALGLLAWNEGRLRDGDSLFRSSLDIAREAGDSGALARASGNLALVLTDFGDLDSARTLFLTARDMARALGDRRLEGNMATNLGMLEFRFGNLEAADEALARARHLYRETSYATGEQNALGQLATVYLARGEPQRAFAALDSALAIVRTQGLKQEEASDLKILGDLYASAGALRRAAQYYGESEQLYRRLGSTQEAGTLLRSRAEVYLALGDSISARRTLAAARRLHADAGARAEEIDDRLFAVELTSTGELSQARSELRVADSLARAIGAGSARARVGLAEAALEERAGNARAVLAALARRQRHAASLGSRESWRIDALRARAYARLGLLDSAVTAGRAAVRAVERVRGAFGSAALRTTYTAQRAQVYADLVLLLLRRGDLSAAFEVGDAAHGRGLLEHLAATRAGTAGRSTPNELIAAERVLHRIDALVARLDTLDATPAAARKDVWENDRRAVAGRLVQARAEYEALFARASAGDAAALLGASSLDASRIQQSLRPREALLDYFATPDTLIAFVVTADSVRVVRMRVRPSELAGRVRVVRDLIAARTSEANASRDAARALHDVLIAPAERVGALRGIERLVIVPHGALAYLPFAALRDPRTDRHVVERYAIQYLPSATALPVLRRTDLTAEQTATGTPVGFAPFPDALPATPREVHRFVERVPRASSRVGSAASERALRSALADRGIVHVASHGELNAHNPMFSRIRLAVGRSGDRTDDGRLEVFELFGLSVRSPLVFLSGCDTGSGTAWSTDFEQGEDYVTLARAFLFAGGRNVIATLWRIDDTGAEELAGRFYANLQRMTPADALAAAQRAMLKDTRYAAPYYWAGYQLSGAGY